MHFLPSPPASLCAKCVRARTYSHSSRSQTESTCRSAEGQEIPPNMSRAPSCSFGFQRRQRTGSFLFPLPASSALPTHTVLSSDSCMSPLRYASFFFCYRAMRALTCACINCLDAGGLPATRHATNRQVAATPSPTAKGKHTPPAH